MKLGEDETRRAIADGKIGAITLDTSIFHRQGLIIEQGLLRQVQQFSGSKIAVLLSDVVIAELREALLREAGEAHAGLKKALKSMHSASQVTQETCDQVLASLVGTRTPTEVATARLSAFLKATGAETIESAAHASVAQLLERYFAQRPPFGKENKRHEFPDAFALLSLEHWAEEEKTHVLVVSADNDWKGFCAESDRLVLVEDLATALGLFQNEAAQFYCQEISRSLRDGDPLGLTDAISAALEAQADKISVHLQADSQFSVDGEDEQHTVVLDSIVDQEKDTAFEPVQFDGHTLVSLISVHTTTKITGYFSFAKWDSIDGEYMSMGSGSAETMEELMVDVLVSFTGNFPHKVQIESIEVLPLTVYASFTDLEPQWMQHGPDGDE